eukprot:CAMPEP_0114624370 /NCGR_PEP_ID=MMETSP0168-20121206/10732_1 /TAXON_ID=95228 ORGANISM="Vannella sp., Strain DIVA3 517/6/12" /NCGR_SAMPLE_ID=MMETSP0168 /ASSEMBLY_ACC=CAM_ASM_000044 /LENGTH=57 /DNA_ID=CAMNT_0001835643 /DNA_START=277 /DNA_END=446 /DNA_ORIENTATION=+
MVRFRVQATIAIGNGRTITDDSGAGLSRAEQTATPGTTSNLVFTKQQLNNNRGRNSS